MSTKIALYHLICINTSQTAPLLPHWHKYFWHRCPCCLKWRTWQWPLQLQCLAVGWSIMTTLIWDGSLSFSPGWTGDTRYSAILCQFLTLIEHLLKEHKKIFMNNDYLFSYFLAPFLSSVLLNVFSGWSGPFKGFVWEIYRKHNKL